MEKTYFMGSEKVEKGLGLLLIILSAFFILKGLTVLKEYRFIGSGTTATNTLVISGTGEAYAFPDIAALSFTVRDDASTVKAAQDSVEKKMNSAIAYLKDEGIAEKDIKLEYNSFYPKYDYNQQCYGGLCPTKSPVLTGYEVSRSVSVKIRDIDTSGKIVEGLGKLGVTELSGPTFTVDDEDVVKAEARALAIKDAQAKANELARELGVSIVRIVNFSENNGGYYPQPMYAKTDSMVAMGGAAPESNPILPTGENKYSSNVSITFEIR